MNKRGLMGASVRIKLTIFVAAVVVVTAAALGHVASMLARRALRNEIHERLTVVAADRQKLLLSGLQREEERLALVASRTQLRQIIGDHLAGKMPTDTFRGEAERILADARASTPDILDIWITDKTGHTIAATNRATVEGDFSRSREFVEGQNEIHVGVIRMGMGGAQLLVAGPVRDDQARLLGVMMMRVNAGTMARSLIDTRGLGDTGEVVVGMADGDTVEFLLPLRHHPAAERVPAKDLPAMQAAINGEQGFMQTLDYRGVPVLAAYRPVQYEDWALVAKIDLAEAYAPLTRLRRWVFGIETLILIAGVIASYLLAMRFTRPIQKMAQMAEAIGQGLPVPPLRVGTHDEIEVLGTSLNRMNEELAHDQAMLEQRVRDRTAELQAERDLVQSMIDNIPDNIYFKDRQSRFIRINKAMTAWFGFKNADEALGKSDSDIFSREHAQQAFDDEARIMQTGEPVVGKEEKETWPDETVTWVSTTKAPLRDKEGQIVGTFGISRDITERKRAQEQLARFAEELDRKNRQLEEDLGLALEVQQAFLPKSYPVYPRGVTEAESALRFSRRYIPASTVGGDFFTVLPLSGSEAGVLVCDVMGHGMRAALVMAIVRGLMEELRYLADDPGRFLTEINLALTSILQPSSMPIFATAVYVVVDAQRGGIRYASAGHPSPILVPRGSGEVTKLLPADAAVGPGPALGLVKETLYASQARSLAVGDRVLLYTDGLYEVEGAGGDYYGQDRLVAAIGKCRDLAGNPLLEQLLAEIRAYAVNGEFLDDVCLVAIEWTKPCPPPPG